MIFTSNIGGNRASYFKIVNSLMLENFNVNIQLGTNFFKLYLGQNYSFYISRLFTYSLIIPNLLSNTLITKIRNSYVNNNSPNLKVNNEKKFTKFN